MIKQKTKSYSSFRKKSQNYLLNFLVEQMGLSEQNSIILIRVHDCITTTEAMQLFIKTDQGTYKHIFIPNQNDLCEICDQNADSHDMVDDNLLRQSYQAYKEHKQSEKSSIQEDFMIQPFEQLDQNNQQLCQICYIEYKSQDFTHLNGQVHQICLNCMSQYIKSEINQMKVQYIQCPHCGIQLSSQIIEEFVNHTTYEKYRTFLRNIQIQKNPHLKWCPNPKCSIVIQLKSNKKTINCPKCFIGICTHCNRESHPRMSCNSVFKNQIRNWQKSTDIQKCKKCKALVQKISGCNHMSCMVCEYQWCWLCGATYSDAHFSPLNPLGCPGLQDTDHSNWGKCRIILFRLAIFFGILLAIPILLPFILLGCGPYFMGNIIINHCYPYRHSCRCLIKFILLIISFALGILVDPFVWIGATLYYSPKLITWIYDYYQQRRQNENNINDFLNVKLLKQANDEGGITVYNEIQ